MAAPTTQLGIECLCCICNVASGSTFTDESERVRCDIGVIETMVAAWVGQLNQIFCASSVAAAMSRSNMLVAAKFAWCGGGRDPSLFRGEPRRIRASFCVRSEEASGERRYRTTELRTPLFSCWGDMSIRSKWSDATSWASSLSPHCFLSSRVLARVHRRRYRSHLLLARAQCCRVVLSGGVRVCFAFWLP